jgi:hypothetical protein
MPAPFREKSQVRELAYNSLASVCAFLHADLAIIVDR